MMPPPVAATFVGADSASEGADLTEIRKLQQLLALLGECSAAMVRARSEEQLLSTLCELLVQRGAYDLACVGLHSPTGLRLAACSAAEEVPRPTHWAAVEQTCFAGSLSLSLGDKQHALGVLRIFSNSCALFGTDEHMVLNDLAINIGFGLSVFESGIERRRLGERVGLLSQAIDQNPMSIFVTDLDGRIQYCNPAFSEQTGYTQEEARGQTPRLFKSGQTPAEVYAGMWRTLLAGGTWQGELLNRRKDGTVTWEREWISPLTNEHGEVVNYIAMKEDISARKQSREQLRLRERAIESSCNGIMITSATQLDHPITYVNPAFERITGYSATDALGRNGRFLVRDDLSQKGLNDIRTALRDKQEGHAILRNYRKDGSLFWNELFIAPVLDESGQATTHFISIINDVTDRIRYEQQLEYQSNHDVLTALANRNLLNDRIAQAIAHARRDRHLVGLLLLDLDRFKLINDGFGHTPADDLLKAVATRLLTCVRDTDTVARIGGDEFVIVVTDIQDPDDISVVAEKIQRSLAQPFYIEGKEVFITASIGISQYPRDGDHGEALLRNADVAMYRVKEHGRDNYRFYLPEMSNMALDRLDMEGSLRKAIENGELVVYYQPKVCLKTGAIVGAEALVRWLHPRMGQVSPGEFIPLAEETGLIIPLGDLVLNTVCQQIRHWKESGLQVPLLSINISARQFRQENLVETICRRLAQANIDGSAIELELTESMVMQDADGAIGTLRELKQLGLGLALDDFGTGYSSLAYLKRFPIDTLKIDRSFVRDITSNRDDAAIACAVVAMAHSLKLKVVAEGVETREQLALLQQEGCDELQGYLFSHPVPADAFAQQLLDGKTLALDPLPVVSA